MHGRGLSVVLLLVALVAGSVVPSLAILDTLRERASSFSLDSALDRVTTLSVNDMVDRVTSLTLDSAVDRVTSLSVSDVTSRVRDGVGDLDLVDVEFPSTECGAAGARMWAGCGAQYRWLYRTFGYPLESPNLTPEMQTYDVLAGMPHPGPACCDAAYDFHTNLCACDTDVIKAFRASGGFDPEATEPSAWWIYGHQCGGPVVTGDSCPYGNPFWLIRLEEGK